MVGLDGTKCCIKERTNGMDGKETKRKDKIEKTRKVKKKEKEIKNRVCKWKRTKVRQERNVCVTNLFTA